MRSLQDLHDFPTMIHASCVALSTRRALLIVGPSGSGKSTLALSLMGFGAQLVSDDQTVLSMSSEGAIIATAPENISGMIEARGLGLLSAEPMPNAMICAIVDMAETERERLPQSREISLAGTLLPVFQRVEGPGFAPGLWQWLKGGRCA